MIDKNFRPLREYLDVLPEPKTFHEKVICWWSNIIDDMTIILMRIKRKNSA